MNKNLKIVSLKGREGLKKALFLYFLLRGILLLMIDVTKAEAQALREKFPWLKIGVGNPHKRSSHKAYYMPEERVAMNFLWNLRSKSITERHYPPRATQTRGR